MLNALEATLGIVTTAAENVGISRTAHYNWMKEDQEYARSVHEIENRALDFAESMLHKRMREGDTTSIIFYLKCKGKGRGYIDKILDKVDPKTTTKKAKKSDGGVSFRGGPNLKVS